MSSQHCHVLKLVRESSVVSEQLVKLHPLVLRRADEGAAQAKSLLVRRLVPKGDADEVRIRAEGLMVRVASHASEKSSLLRLELDAEGAEGLP